MAFTFQEEVSNGVQTVYPVDFDFRDTSTVYVYTGEHSDYGTQISYRWITGNQEIELLNISEVPSGTKFYIRRIVPRDDLVHKFVDRSIRGRLVDEENYHLLYLVQEFMDGFMSLEELQGMFNNLDMRGNLIKNLGDAVDDTDAVNMRTVQTLIAVVKGANFVQEDVPTLGLAQGVRWYKPSANEEYIYYIDTKGDGLWTETTDVGDNSSAETVETANGSTVQHQIDIKDGLTVTEAVNLDGIASLLGNRIWLKDRDAWCQVVLSSTFSNNGEGADELTSVANSNYGLKLLYVDNLFSARAFGLEEDTDFSVGLQRMEDLSLDRASKITFGAVEFEVSQPISKSHFSNWVGVAGTNVDPGKGTVIQNKQNGRLLEFSSGLTLPNSTGIEGVVFREEDPVNRPNAQCIVFTGSPRRSYFRDMFISGFRTAIAGPNGTMYCERVFVTNHRYGFLQIGASDSWYSYCHAGSGLVPTHPDAHGGAAFYFDRGANLTFDHCRGQVQAGGFGFEIKNTTELTINSPIADQNEAGGFKLIHVSDCDITNQRTFDNGQAGDLNSAIVIEAKGYSCSFDNTNNTLNFSVPPDFTEERTFVEFTTTGTLPPEIVEGTEYLLIKVTDQQFRVAATRQDVLEGNFIVLTGNGSGTRTCHGITKDIRITGGAIFDRGQDKQGAAVSFVKTGGGKIKNITLSGVDISKLQSKLLGVANVDEGLKVIDCNGFPLVTRIPSASATLRIGSVAQRILVSNPLTADVILTLAGTGVYRGAEFEISRGEDATGAFDVVIHNEAGVEIDRIPVDAAPRRRSYYWFTTWVKE